MGKIMASRLHMRRFQGPMNFREHVYNKHVLTLDQTGYQLAARVHHYNVMGLRQRIELLDSTIGQTR